MKDNWFLIKLCFKNAPLYTTWYMMDKIRNEILIFLEHIIAISVVLSAVEFGRPFRGVAIFLVLLFLAEIFHMIVDSYRQKKLEPKAMPLIYKSLKDKLFAKANGLDMNSYDDPEFYNEYILAINESNAQIDKTLANMDDFVSSVTRVLLAGGFFLAVDMVSFVFVVIVCTAVFVLKALVDKLAYKRTLETNEVARKAGYINRVFYLPDYAKELRLNPEISEKFMGDFDDLTHNLEKISKKYATKIFWIEWVKDYIFGNFIMVSVYISYLAYSALVMGNIGIGQIVVMLSALHMLIGGFEWFSSTITNMIDIGRYVKRIKLFLDREPSISTGIMDVPTKIDVFELKNVSLRYSDTSPYCLNNINMRITTGNIAIVGYNGAGKSTLVKLIMRLYDPTEGEILLNGVNIKSYDIDKYRKAIGVIFQDYKIFGGTIKENILLDIPSNTEHEDKLILSSLDRSGFTQKLNSLPNGIETNLLTEFEENGVNLSGGEAQKIAMARAFYKNVGMIILDEPSSALDPIAEYHFNNTFTQEAQDNIKIFISHRLSTTRLADKIYLLENGNIKEEGTHSELLEKQGVYAQMWDVQTSRFRIEEIT